MRQRLLQLTIAALAGLLLCACGSTQTHIVGSHNGFSGGISHRIAW